MLQSCGTGHNYIILLMVKRENPMLSQVSLLNRPSRLSKPADVNVGATHSIFDGLIDEVRI